LTSKEIEKLVKKQVKNQKELVKLQRGWKKGRMDLVKSAGSIARGQQKFQDLLRKWIEDKLMAPLMWIVDLLEGISAFFTGGAVEAARAYKVTGRAIGGMLDIPEAKAPGKMFIERVYGAMEAKELVGAREEELKPLRETLRRAAASGDPEAFKRASANLAEKLAEQQTEAVSDLMKEVAKRGRKVAPHALKQLAAHVVAGQDRAAIAIMFKILGKEYVKQKVAGQKKAVDDKQIEAAKAGTLEGKPGFGGFGGLQPQ
jgi:hypothetical protein